MELLSFIDIVIFLRIWKVPFVCMCHDNLEVGRCFVYSVLRVHVVDE